MTERLPNGTQVKVREFTGKVISAYQSGDGTWRYEVSTGDGHSDWADIPEYMVSEIFTGIDTCLYMDGSGNVYVFYTSDNKFREVIKDGLRSINTKRYDYDELTKPVRRMVTEGS